MTAFNDDTEYILSSTEVFTSDFYNLSSNASSNASMQEFTCNREQYLIDKLYVKMSFVLLYFIIFCLGFFGNILGKNQKVENVYSDILILGRLYKNKFLLTLCLSESFNT